MGHAALDAILDDLDRPDSTLMVEFVGSVLSGASFDQANARLMASVAYAAVRELVPIIHQLRDRGDDRAQIRAYIGLALDRMDFAADRRRVFEAVADRALASAFGPDPVAD